MINNIIKIDIPFEFLMNSIKNLSIEKELSLLKTLNEQLQNEE